MFRFLKLIVLPYLDGNLRILNSTLITHHVCRHLFIPNNNNNNRLCSVYHIFILHLIIWPSTCRFSIYMFSACLSFDWHLLRRSQSPRIINGDWFSERPFHLCIILTTAWNDDNQPIDDLELCSLALGVCWWHNFFTIFLFIIHIFLCIIQFNWMTSPVVAFYGIIISGNN